MDHTQPEIAVVIRLVLQGIPYRANAKMCLCPFCRNIEEDKKECGMCEGAGIIIKIKVPDPVLELSIIPGGKK